MVKSHHLHGSSAANSAGSAAFRLVYCQDNEIARLLKGQNCDWIIAPLPGKFSDSPAVVVADDLKVFSDDLRDAIANDRARLFTYHSRQKICPTRRMLSRSFVFWQVRCASRRFVA